MSIVTTNPTTLLSNGYMLGINVPNKNALNRYNIKDLEIGDRGLFITFVVPLSKDTQFAYA
jgi:hypothetical protein